MNQINVTDRSLGVRFTPGGESRIRVWAPKAGEVAIKLPEQQLLIPLEREDYGYWSIHTYQIEPGDLYQVVLDGKTERPDPASLSQPRGVHGPSEAVNLADYPWSDGKWRNIPLEDYILYELHTGTFTPAGTFAALEEKLDYLINLGVNAIELMPVAQFPGTRNWGYDGVFPYAVQDSYGGARGLQHLVDVCHSKGLAVILDLVYNHLGPEGNYLGSFGPYFTDKYNTPWGPAINFDDAGCDGVRRYYTENLLMWFRDFHLDAVRLDAVHAIKDFSPIHILRDMKQHLNQLMQETGRVHYMIVELDLNDTRFIKPLEEQGYGMDAQWIDEFHHALRVTATGENSGYYADFSGIGHLAKAYRDAYVYDGQYSPHRDKVFGIPAEHREGRQFVVFSQNHDQVGNRMLGERTTTLTSFEMQKLLAGAVIASPYLPMLWMGEEYSEPHPFLYFVSHTDPELAEAVRKGRKAEFAAFHSQGDAPDPMDEATFRESKLQWDLLNAEPHQTMFRWYQTLIRLRKEQPALRQLNRQNLAVEADETNKTLLLHRWHENQHLICLMNFSKGTQQIIAPAHASSWRKLLDSADPEWKGPGAAPETLAPNNTIALCPESFVLYVSGENGSR
jgi:maltooligosyltrehalose trehalohydrolase